MGKTKNNEWTSVWLQHYSRPQPTPLQSINSASTKSDSSSTSSTASSSSTLLNDSHYLFSPPTPDPDAKSSSLAYLSAYPPSPEPVKPARFLTPSNRPLPSSPEATQPLIIRKRSNGAAVAASRVHRALPTLPQTASAPAVLTLNAAGPASNSKGHVRTESKSRKRPVPILLAPSSSGLSALHPNTNGPIIITPSWSSAFPEPLVASRTSSPVSSPSLYAPSSMGVPPSPAAVSQMHSAKMEQCLGGAARSPVILLASPGCSSSASSSYYSRSSPGCFGSSSSLNLTSPSTSLRSAGLMKRFNKPITQDMPRSAVIYEERLLCSESEDSLYLTEEDLTDEDLLVETQSEPTEIPEDEMEVIEEDYGYYNLDDLDLGLDLSDEDGMDFIEDIEVELMEVAEAHRNTFNLQRAASPWRVTLMKSQ